MYREFHDLECIGCTIFFLGTWPKCKALKIIYNNKVFSREQQLFTRKFPSKIFNYSINYILEIITIFENLVSIPATQHPWQHQHHLWHKTLFKQIHRLSLPPSCSCIQHTLQIIVRIIIHYLMKHFNIIKIP